MPKNISDCSKAFDICSCSFWKLPSLEKHVCGSCQVKEALPKDNKHFLALARGDGIVGPNAAEPPIMDWGRTKLSLADISPGLGVSESIEKAELSFRLHLSIA